MSYKFSKILHLKAKGNRFTRSDIDEFVSAVTEARIGSHQVGAFLMASYINGLSVDETRFLTESMIQHGSRLTWGSWLADKPAELAQFRSRIVDKHSTGGVGDKVSIVLAPLAVTLGLIVPMISGRGLGHTGGTIDKLESIPGYQCELEVPVLETCIREVGCFICSQNASLAPADRVLYKCRNDTGTVDSIGLITASIMSKKCVEGIQGLLLDVKYGSGGFMKTREDAQKLADSMQSVGNLMNVRTTAILSPMDTPLGYYVGNALEIAECILIMQGQLLDSDLVELTIQSCVLMHQLAGLSGEQEAAEVRQKCVTNLQNGAALAVFKNMLVHQGVEADFADRLCSQSRSEADIMSTLQHVATNRTEIKSPRSGTVRRIDALSLGELCCQLGGGKFLPEDSIDFSVGFRLLRKEGHTVQEGEELLAVYHSSPLTSEQLNMVSRSIEVD